MNKIIIKEFIGPDEEKTALGIKASSINISKLKSHIKPQQVRDEIPTLNKTGYMKFEYEFFNKYFVDIAKTSSLPLLDIGPAYGWTTHKVLESGCQVVAADISKEHLEVLIKEAPQSSLNNLYIYHASFPDEMDFPSNTFRAILMSRIMHFLTGEEIERGLDKIHRWLSEGGEFIATNCSIYHSSIKKKMHEVFQDRMRNRVKWAGMVNNKDYDPVHKAPVARIIIFRLPTSSLIKFGAFIIVCSSSISI